MMKERELREAADCVICNKPFGHQGLMFWRVTAQRYIADPRAITRQTGLEMMIGVPLAQVMGASEDMAKPITEPVTVTVCERCAAENTTVYELAFSDELGGVEV